MLRRVEISGHSVAAAYAALLMREAGFEVVWRHKPYAPRCRPFRLASQLVSAIKRLAIKMNTDCSELLSSPLQGAWRTVEARAFRFNFDFFEHSLSRWVDETSLLGLFSTMAKNSGVQIDFVENYQAPLEGINHLHVVAADEDDMLHWPRDYFSIDREAIAVEYSELWFPTGRIEYQGDAFFFSLEGALVFLEPRGNEGYVLSVVSGARYCTERAVRAIQSASSGIPIFLKSLALMNAGARRLDKRFYYGGAELVMPNVFSLAAAVGTYPESVNIQSSEYLNQAQRLASLLRQGTQQNVDVATMCHIWRHKERRFYENAYSRARLWERLMYSPRGQRFVLPTAQWLPGRMRQILKAPF